ncbi:MAG: hypothetical protein IMZ44_24950, partial [Planctomycetes bacterium]|nr:hypothetical protein [Planctomycetota bacterium]
PDADEKKKTVGPARAAEAPAAVEPAPPGRPAAGNAADPLVKTAVRLFGGRIVKSGN